MNHAKLLSEIRDSIISANTSLHRAQMLTQLIREDLSRQRRFTNADALYTNLVSSFGETYKQLESVRRLEEDLEMWRKMDAERAAAVYADGPEVDP